MGWSVVELESWSPCLEPYVTMQGNYENCAKEDDKLQTCIYVYTEFSPLFPIILSYDTTL